MLLNDTEGENALRGGEHHRLLSGCQRHRRLQQQRHLHLHTQRLRRPPADSFTYTIVDEVGNTDTATVDVTVTPVSDPPTVGNVIPDQLSPRQAFWQFQVAANAFSDPDFALTYTAKLGNGDPLPAWLTFDAGTQTFSGTPPRDGALNQAIQLRVTASDGVTNVSDTFSLNL